MEVMEYLVLHKDVLIVKSINFSRTVEMVLYNKVNDVIVALYYLLDQVV